MTFQYGFDTLEKAKTRAKELVERGDLEDDSLQIIHDFRKNRFYVEDGTPLIRPAFEKILWSL